MHAPRPLNQRTGIAFFLAAWAVVPFMDVSAKALGNLAYPVWMIVWGRFAAALILLLPLLAVGHKDAFKLPAKLPLQVLRVVFLAAATLGFFMGLRTLPLADALAIYFIYPFVVTALAPLFLGEVPGVRRWAAIAVGFCGTLLIVQPGFGTVPPGTGYVLAAAVAFAAYNVLTRRIASDAGPWQVLVFQSGAGMVLTAPMLLGSWQTPDAAAAGLFFAMGLAATGGHYLLIRAYEHAPASVLAPFSYVEIISATALGFIFFGDFPHLMTWAGIAVIVASGLYIGYRERRHAGA